MSLCWAESSCAKKEEFSMIVRTWRGWTRPEDAERYVSYIEDTGLAAYRTTPGNQGAYLTSRPDGDKTEFLTISFWDSEESIRGFAGDDIEAAVFYPEDDQFLVARETFVRHYQVP
jgi:heme-degrading monooxygenase HmoA